MQFILAKDRDISEHKAVCNQIYFEAVNTPLGFEKTIDIRLANAKKTNSQLRGYWRLVSLILPHLKEAYLMVFIKYINYLERKINLGNTLNFLQTFL